MINNKKIFYSLFSYGVTHALVDAICAGVVFTIIKNEIIEVSFFLIAILLYNLIAFGSQFIFGIISDRFKKPKIVALIGCLCVGISSITFSSIPFFSVVLVAIGNALFHVGGGSISLNLMPGKATAPGIYVAPGALGLLLGIFLGKSGQFIVWPFLLTLIIFSFLIFKTSNPILNYDKSLSLVNNKKEINYFLIIIYLASLSIVIRSFLGMALAFPWKINIILLLLLTISIALGKGIGGFLADKFGWIRVSIFSLILSIPFIIIGFNFPIFAMLGMFLFNITMPVTLTLISNIIPGRPGFAFGLTCLSLIVGSLPTFFFKFQLFNNEFFILIVIFISTISLYLGLKLFNKNKDL